MPTLSFSDEVTPYIPLLRTLTASFEYSVIAPLSSLGSEDDKLQKIQAFLSKAETLGIPSRFLFSSTSRRSHRTSLISACLEVPRAQKAVKALIAAGACIWVSSFDEFSNTFHFVESGDLANIIFGSSRYSNTPYPLFARKAAFSCALQHTEYLSDTILSEFINHLIDRYKRLTYRSSSTSSGIMGKRDKIAKDSAMILLEFLQPLLELAKQRYPSSVSNITEIAEDAKKRLEAKTRESEFFDPEKLKKSLTPQQKIRLITLSKLAETCAEDGEAMNVLMDNTPWLKDHPQALCITLNKRPSLAATALTCAREETLNALDRFGSNLWLASAQGGQGNACLWVAELLSQRWRRKNTEIARVQSMMKTAAKLLAYGAFLDGASDPVSHAVTKCDEALQQVKKNHYRPEQTLATLADLRSRIEALAIQDILANRQDNDSESSASAEPVKRKSRSL